VSEDAPEGTGASRPRPRPWDRFLTKQDRAHLAREAAAGRQARADWGPRPALVLIDL
jgi:hypothetical protein